VEKTHTDACPEGMERVGKAGGRAGSASPAGNLKQYAVMLETFCLGNLPEMGEAIVLPEERHMRGDDGRAHKPPQRSSVSRIASDWLSDGGGACHG